MIAWIERRDFNGFPGDVLVESDEPGATVPAGAREVEVDGPEYRAHYNGDIVYFRDGVDTREEKQDE